MRCLLIAILLIPYVAFGQQSSLPTLPEEAWTAAWIAHPTAPPDAFGVFHFRRTFELGSVPDTFIVHVSADNRYRLFVNGASVSSGPARGDLMHWRYESVDLAPHLRAGTNVLAAVVWNFAEHRPQAQFSYRTAFIVQGHSEQEAVVNTGDQWRVVQNEGYAPIPVDREALGWVYIVVGPGERVDGSSYPWGWTSPTHDDAAWPQAAGVRKAVQQWGPNTGIYTGWRLVPRRIPAMEELLERIPVIRRAEGVSAEEGFLRGEVDLVVPANTQATVLLDQTHLTTAYPELLVSGGAGSRVRLTYAEALFDAAGHKGHRDEVEGKTIRGIYDEFLPDGGEQRLFRPLWWRTYRYLQLDVETAGAPLAIHDLRGVFTAYPFQQRASFVAADPSLETIWNVGWRTARLCAGETYFDCPYYEQLQYVGDTRIQALVSLYVAGDDRLMRKAIDLFDASRIPEGLTQSRYPAWETQFIPPYSLFWIAMIYDYWMHRDDPEYVASFLDGIDGVIGWYAGHIDETGMVGAVPWWNYVDWAFERGVPPGADEGHSSIISLQFAYVLNYAARLAGAFGREADAARYQDLAGQLKTATYERCWDTARQLFADTPSKATFSQHANILGVLTDALPVEDQPELMALVDQDTTLTQATYYFRYYLDRAMKKAGLAEYYVDRLQPWHTMLGQGLTTFAEEPEPTRSDAHAWSSSPNYHFLETVLGIEPAEPGFRSVRIAPALGSLEWAEGSMPHPLGSIEVKLRRTDGGGVDGEVTLPDGLTGIFVWSGHTQALRSGTQDIVF